MIRFKKGILRLSVTAVTEALRMTQSSADKSIIKKLEKDWVLCFN